MEVSDGDIKDLDRFYNELRRKYPNTFTLATDLGKGGKAIHKLPRLDKPAPQTPFGLLPGSSSSFPSQRWTPDSFLYKVQSQKTIYGQSPEGQTSHNSGGSVVIQGKPVSVPTRNRSDYPGAQNRVSFRLPSLRTQVEQNKAELKTRLSAPKAAGEPKTQQNTLTNPSNDTKTFKPLSSGDGVSNDPDGHQKPAGIQPDPLGTIMKELLPNKPGRLMNDLPKASKNTPYRNAGSISDSDSGISVCTPIKIFRPKSRSPHGPPASSDIIKKFSAKPKVTQGPIKANHGIMPETGTEAQRISEKTDEDESSRRSSDGSQKTQQRPSTSRVRFEDESEQEAESRYQERCLLGRKEAVKTECLGGKPIGGQERLKTCDPVERSSSLPWPGNQQAISQHAVTLPYRRQPFPPSVAKKVLIDIPRGAAPNKRILHRERLLAMKSVADNQLSPRYQKEAASLDGITMSFASTSDQWKAQGNVGRRAEQNKDHQSTSSMETIESGTTEVSSDVTIMRTEWGGSGSSISNENLECSPAQIHGKRLGDPAPGSHLMRNHRKESATEISFYSKMKRSLHVKMKQTSDTKKLSGSSQSEGSDLLDLSSESLGSDLEPPHSLVYVGSQGKVEFDRKPSPHGAISRTLAGSALMKEETLDGATKMTPAAEQPTPVKAPFFHMKRMTSFLRKGRAKDYLVHVPSPPPLDLKPPLLRAANPTTRKNKVQTEHASDAGHTMGRLLAVHPDSSRVVELRRPPAGFHGLYLAKKSQDHDAGLYVVQLGSVFTSTYPQGVLKVGDEILEINKRRANDLSVEEINALFEESSCVLLHVLPTAVSSRSPVQNVKSVPNARYV